MEEFEKCRNYACKLLKYRSRSQKEIEDRLKKKKFSAEIIEKVIPWLKEKQYLDDLKFAQEWIAQRKRKGYSEKLIRWELKQKGVSEEMVSSNLSNQEGLLSDKEVAKKLVEKKIKLHKNLEPVKVKQRVQSLLLRRGFSWEVIGEILGKIGRE